MGGISFGLGLFVGILIAVLSMASNHTLPDQIREQAVANGAAEYVCDTKSGDCVFTWRGALPEPPKEEK